MLQEPLQKVTFRAAKGGFSARDLWPFTTQKAVFWKTASRRHLSDRTYGRIRDEWDLMSWGYFLHRQKHAGHGSQACHTRTASAKQYGNRTIKNGTPDASAYKTVKTLHNSHIVQAWDKNFFAKQKKRVSVVRDIRKPCVIHRLTHGNAALRSRIFMPNRYHTYGIQPLSQQPRSKAGGI